MNRSLKLFLSLSLCTMACSAAVLASGTCSADSPFSAGSVVAVMPQTLPKPPPRPKPGKASIERELLVQT